MLDNTLKLATAACFHTFHNTSLTIILQIDAV
jgi:hypothetical protein